MPLNQKNAIATFVRQHDTTDCGVACLRSLLRYYGGEVSPERLREISGTNRQGTTLLGMQQAAFALGFAAEGCEADDLAALVDHGQPCVLHVLIPGNLQHYVVWYGLTYIDPGSVEKRHAAGSPVRLHLVGDPGRGMVTLTDAELDAMWQSKKCLTLAPTDQLESHTTQKNRQLQWLLALVREDRELLATAAVLGLFIAALSMAMAVFSQRLIDDILPGKDHVKLFGGIALVAFLLAVRVGFETLRGYLLLRQSKEFNNRIIGQFYDGLLRLPKAFFDTRKTGDLVARMNDTARIQRVLAQLSGQVLIDLMVVVVSLAFIWAYSWRVAAGLGAALPCYFLFIYRFRHGIRRGQQGVMASYARNESNYISTLQGIRAIKAFNRQADFGTLNRTTYGHFQDNIIMLGMVQLRLGAGASLASVGLLMAVLGFASYQVLYGTLKTGELMALLGMASTLLPAVANLALITVPFTEAKVAFERMFEFMGRPPEATDSGPALNEDVPAVEFEQIDVRGVSFRFPGRAALLSDVSLTLRRGEILGMVGESGSGKSTLVQLLERFYVPESGQITVDRRYALADLPLTEWRQQAVAVPQEIHLFNGTLLDNILLGAVVKDESAFQSFLEKPAFRQFWERLPQGLHTLVGEEGINLSGGQRQWVGLMRALHRQPRVLLLDEATSAMDAHSEQLVFELLRELRPQMAVLFVTHRLHVLPRLCDRICLLESGHPTLVGTHEALLAGNNLYSRFWQDLEIGFFSVGQRCPESGLRISQGIA
jgi:ABC-type bacteriocin/lantibiotic exporter with double-glycine peptidase domain